MSVAVSRLVFDAAVYILTLILVLVDILCSLACAVLRRCQGGPKYGNKKVVIIGGSFSSLWCQRNLCSDFDVTVIDFKDYFEYTPGILRAFCNPAHLRCLTCPIPTHSSRLLLVEAVCVKEKCVMVRDVASGQMSEVPFDYLIAGCGSLYQAPIKPSSSEPHVSDRRATWDEENRRLQAAASVLVIGGGPVGVELAAEIMTYYPDKKMTIVDMAANLCAPFPPKSQEYIEEWFVRRGATLVLDATIAGKLPELRISDHGCELTDGRQLQADIVYRCTGFKPNSSIFAEHFAEHVDRRGSVLVDDTLRLASHSNIFVIGDVMLHGNSNELKLGHTAEVNAHLVVDNIYRLQQGEPLLTYPDGVTGGGATPKIFAVSLGKYQGSLGFNWLVLNGALPALVKWLLEYTKTAACGDKPLGVWFWKFGDWFSFLLGRTLLAPAPKQVKKVD